MKAGFCSNDKLAHLRSQDGNLETFSIKEKSPKTTFGRTSILTLHSMEKQFTWLKYAHDMDIAEFRKYF